MLTDITLLVHKVGVFYRVDFDSLGEFLRNGNHIVVEQVRNLNAACLYESRRERVALFQALFLAFLRCLRGERNHENLAVYPHRKPHIRAVFFKAHAAVKSVQIRKILRVHHDDFRRSLFYVGIKKCHNYPQKKAFVKKALRKAVASLVLNRPLSRTTL